MTTADVDALAPAVFYSEVRAAWVCRRCTCRIARHDDTGCTACTPERCVATRDQLDALAAAEPPRPPAAATCVLPGCRNRVPDPTRPCGECVQVFGPMLARAPQADPVTVAQVQARDAATREAYRRQHAVELGEDALGVRKAGQRCWLCEERRTCVRVQTAAAGLEWECPACTENV